MTVTRTSLRALTTSALVAAVLGAGLPGAPGALAAGRRAARPAPRPAPQAPAAPSRAQLVARVLAVAAAESGRPYRYGAAGPAAFDCSGYVQFVFRTATGRRLPRTTGAQYAASRHVREADRQPGDLVFLVVGGRMVHVGIYAGGNAMWVAPHPGSTVRREPLWAARFAYGRVL